MTSVQTDRPVGGHLCPEIKSRRYPWASGRSGRICKSWFQRIAVRFGKNINGDGSCTDLHRMYGACRNVIGVTGLVMPGLAVDSQRHLARDDRAPLRSVRMRRDRAILMEPEEYHQPRIRPHRVRTDDGFREWQVKRGHRVKKGGQGQGVTFLSGGAAPQIRAAPNRLLWPA